jgi:hypothetical protein
VDRLESDPRTESCPNQVRYLWEGTPAVGEKLVFTQVYYPHPPYRSHTSSNNPGSKGAYANELQATAHASGIKVVRDDTEASILRLELEAGHVEWVAFNPQSKSLKMDSIVTNDPLGYWHSSKP